VPFGTVHPALSPEQNLRHLQDNGITGVKLHPLFQDVSLADPRLAELMAALADAGIIVITHVGAGGDDAANERGAPQHLRTLADKVPRLELIACHYGGYHRLDEAEGQIVGSRVLLETSWPPTMRELSAARVRAIIARHGASRVVFGSDWPMTDPAAEIAAIQALGLPPAEEGAVLGGNLASLLGLQQAR
jgi:predicted TIM-barrel fold metal-dependent hydrolase